METKVDEYEKFYKLQSELIDILYLVRDKISNCIEYCTNTNRDNNDILAYTCDYNNLRLYEIRSIYDFINDAALVEPTKDLGVYIEKLKDCYFHGNLSDHTQSVLPKNTIELIIREMEKIAYA